MRWMFRTALILVLIVVAQTTAFSEVESISGTVTDPFGVAIADVELLIFSAAGKSEPLARIRSNRAGKFSTTLTAVGKYRIAALKEGYGTLFKVVQWVGNKPLALVLMPESAAAAQGKTIPKDSAWALRVPRRHPWRQIESVFLPNQEVSPEQSIQGQVVQALGFAMATDRSGRSTGLGQETGLVLTGALDESTIVQLKGRSNRVEDQTDWSRRRQEFLDFSLNHANDEYGNFSLNAFFDRNHPLATSVASLAEEVSQDRRWGYNASWSQNQPLGRWRVDLEYLGLGKSLMDPSTSTRSLSQQEKLGASGVFELQSLEGHQISVAVHADYAQTPSFLKDSANVSMESFFDWVLGLEVSDVMQPTQAWQLRYGLGVTQFLGHDGMTVLSPELGAAWSDYGITVEGELTWYKSSSAESDSVTSSPIEDLDDSLGYVAAIEAPIGFVALRFESNRRLLHQTDTLNTVSSRPQLTALSTTELDVHEHSWGLHWDTRHLEMHADWMLGEAKGFHSIQATYGDPSFSSHPVPLGYRRATVGFSSSVTGTQANLRWQRLEESAVEGGVVEHSMQLEVAQALSLGGEAQSPWGWLFSWRRASLDRGYLQASRIQYDEIRSGVQVHF